MSKQQVEQTCECAQCGKALDQEDYCYGCTSFICEEHGDAPWGTHEPEDHKKCDHCGESHDTDECDSHE